MVRDETAYATDTVDEPTDLPDDDRSTKTPTSKDQEVVHRALQKIHANMNHLGNRFLVTLLKRRGSPPWVLNMAKDLKCSVCEQFQKRKPLPPASGHLSLPLDVVQIDGMDWIHPGDLTRARATVMVEEGSGKVVVVCHKTVPDRGNVGNTDWQTL